MIYPQRTITNLTLLKGGQNVRITTYLFMNMRHYFETPLDTLSCARSRATPNHQMNMKVKDMKLYFQLDKKSGNFVEPLLFDNVVGLKRF